MENKNKKTNWEDFKAGDVFSYFPKDNIHRIYGECTVAGVDEEYIHYSHTRHFQMKKEDFNEGINKEEIMVCNCSDKDDN